MCCAGILQLELPSWQLALDVSVNGALLCSQQVRSVPACMLQLCCYVACCCHDMQNAAQQTIIMQHAAVC